MKRKNNYFYFCLIKFKLLKIQKEYRSEIFQKVAFLNYCFFIMDLKPQYKIEQLIWFINSNNVKKLLGSFTNLQEEFNLEKLFNIFIETIKYNNEIVKKYKFNLKNLTFEDHSCDYYEVIIYLDLVQKFNNYLINNEILNYWKIIDIKNKLILDV